MNRYPFILLTNILIMLLTACSGNRLKNDEKKLAAEILLQEKEETEREVREKPLGDTLKKLPPGFRFKEMRSADPSKPPVVIDIAGSLNNIKAFKLSDVSSKIT